MPTFYEILGVGESASSEEIRTAWRQAATKHHPDAGGRAEGFLVITEAYEVLSDAVERRLYDQRLEGWRGEQVRAGRSSTGAARSATTERTGTSQPGTSQPGTARSSAGAAGSPGSSNAGRASEGPDPKEVARRADLKIRRFVGLVKSNGRLALLLVGLGWLSVALRSFGMVTVFEPRDAQGNLIFGGLPDLPAPNVSLMINCLLIGFVASVVLGPVWRGLDRRGRLVMAGGIELILLAIAGIDQGTGLSLSVLGLVIAGVGGLFTHQHLSSKRARQRSIQK